MKLPDLQLRNGRVINKYRLHAHLQRVHGVWNSLDNRQLSSPTAVPPLFLDCCDLAANPKFFLNCSYLKIVVGS